VLRSAIYVAMKGKWCWRCGGNSGEAMAEGTEGKL